MNLYETILKQGKDVRFVEVGRIGNCPCLHAEDAMRIDSQSLKRTCYKGTKN
jgi:hypothetical protein